MEGIWYREEYKRLKEQYSEKSADFLKEIVANEDYTEEAREAARDVLANNGVYVKVEKKSDDSPATKRSGSAIGEVIKHVAWIQLIVSLFIALVYYSRMGIGTFQIAAVSAGLAFLVPYALGEISCLLAEIRDNTAKNS